MIRDERDGCTHIWIMQISVVRSTLGTIAVAYVDINCGCFGPDLAQHVRLIFGILIFWNTERDVIGAVAIASGRCLERVLILTGSGICRSVGAVASFINLLGILGSRHGHGSTTQS